MTTVTDGAITTATKTVLLGVVEATATDTATMMVKTTLKVMAMVGAIATITLGAMGLV
jgi:hypothetical protein